MGVVGDLFSTVLRAHRNEVGPGLVPRGSRAARRVRYPGSRVARAARIPAAATIVPVRAARCLPTDVPAAPLASELAEERFRMDGTPAPLAWELPARAGCRMGYSPARGAPSPAPAGRRRHTDVTPASPDGRFRVHGDPFRLAASRQAELVGAFGGCKDSCRSAAQSRRYAARSTRRGVRMAGPFHTDRCAVLRRVERYRDQ